MFIMSFTRFGSLEIYTRKKDDGLGLGRKPGSFTSNQFRADGGDNKSRSARMTLL
jgi:hypothetical protein